MYGRLPYDRCKYRVHCTRTKQELNSGSAGTNVFGAGAECHHRRFCGANQTWATHRLTADLTMRLSHHCVKPTWVYMLPPRVVGNLTLSSNYDDPTLVHRLGRRQPDQGKINEFPPDAERARHFFRTMARLVCGWPKWHPDPALIGFTDA